MSIAFTPNSSGLGVSSSSTIAITDSCTWLFWMKPISYAVKGSQRRIFQYVNLSSPTANALHLMWNNTQTAVNGGIRLGFQRNFVTTDLLRFDSSGIPFGEWTPVAITYNGNSASTGCRIFWGGTETAVYQSSQNGVGAPRPTLGNLYLGNISSEGRDIDALITNFCIINQILSDNMILRWAKDGMATIPTSYVSVSSNVLAQWFYQNEFSDGSLVTNSGGVIDWSGNGNHASPFPNQPTYRAEEVLSYP